MRDNTVNAVQISRDFHTAASFSSCQLGSALRRMRFCRGASNDRKRPVASESSESRGGSGSSERVPVVPVAADAR